MYVCVHVFTHAHVHNHTYTYIHAYIHVHQVDVAFAAATPSGLVTPVIRSADKKRISEVRFHLTIYEYTYYTQYVCMYTHLFRYAK